MTNYEDIAKVIMVAVDNAKELNHTAVVVHEEKPIFTRMDFCIECDRETLEQVVSYLTEKDYDVATNPGITNHCIYVGA